MPPNLCWALYLFEFGQKVPFRWRRVAKKHPKGQQSEVSGPPGICAVAPYGMAVAWQKHFSRTVSVSTRHTQLQQDTHFRVMRLLHDDPDMTQRELAQELGISTSGLNYCLKALIDKGWVKVQNFSHSKNKFGYVYVLTPVGIAEKVAMTARFLQRKMREYDELKTEIDGLRAEMNTAAQGAGR